jgi:hypothetical protein
MPDALFVNLTPTGDQARDQLRVRRAYARCEMHPGPDLLFFRVIEGRHNWLLSMPLIMVDSLAAAEEVESVLAPGEGVEFGE